MKRLVLLLMVMFAFAFTASAMDLKNGEQLLSSSGFGGYSSITADKVKLVVLDSKAIIKAPMLIQSNIKKVNKENLENGVVCTIVKGGTILTLGKNLEVGWQV